HILHERSLRQYFSILFFIHTATTAISTLSLHDALPISSGLAGFLFQLRQKSLQNTRNRFFHALPICLHHNFGIDGRIGKAWKNRSEEHTSELQSRGHLVCRLLLEKKKNKNDMNQHCNRY